MITGMMWCLQLTPRAGYCHSIAAAILFSFSKCAFYCQINEVHDINGDIVAEEGKEPVHPSKLTLTEALAVESGGMSNISSTC